LDRDEWPFLWLHTTTPVKGREPENALCITGGRGEYWITFNPKSGAEVHFTDPLRGDEVIHVWKSDQGAFVVARNLCNDLSKALMIARYFFDTGLLEPGVRWDKY
jgi:hypothetical protein